MSGVEGDEWANSRGRTQAHGQDHEDTENSTPTTMPLRGGITMTYEFFWYD